MPTDTLCIPITAAADPEVGEVKRGANYVCALGARYTTNFPYRTLAVVADLRYTDDFGVEFRVWRQTLEVPLTDAEGAWRGGTWGSLIQCEAEQNAMWVFPYVGSYRLLLTPAYGDSVAVEGLNNLSLSGRLVK
jgi:gliding motility-associated lipoprotein GldH